MPEDFLDYIGPIAAGNPIDRLGEAGAPAPRARGPRSVTGRVVAVHRRAGGPAGEPHKLDISVGGEAGAEIVVRVPPGVYEAFEGKRAVIYIDD